MRAPKPTGDVTHCSKLLNFQNEHPLVATIIAFPLMQNFMKFSRGQFNTSLFHLSAFFLFLRNSPIMIPRQSTYMT